MKFPTVRSATWTTPILMAQPMFVRIVVMNGLKMKYRNTMKFAKDSNGALLEDGDSVTVIKDLKVKGSSMVIKRGTKVKSIRLTENPEEVDCKIDGSSIVLKTCFLKK